MGNIASFSQTKHLQRFFKIVNIMNSAPSVGNTAHHQFGVSLVFHLPLGKLK